MALSEFQLLKTYATVSGMVSLDMNPGIIYWINNILYFLFVPFTIFTIIGDCFSSNANFERIIQDITVSLSIGEGLFLTLDMYTQRKNIQLFMNEMEYTITQKRVFLKNGQFKGSFIVKTLDKMDKSLNSLMSFVGVAILSWVVYPIFTSDKELPLPVEFFNNSKYYWPVFAIQAYSIWSTGCRMLISDSYIVRSIALVCREFSILKHTLENVESNGDAYVMMVKCIEYHQSILRTCDQLQRSISKTIMSRYVYSFANFCFIAYSAVTIQEIRWDFFNWILFLIVTYFIFLMLCWAGNELSVHAESIRMGIWNSKWPDFDKRTKQLCVFAFDKANRAVCLTAINMIPLDIQHFVGILQQSFSNVAVLRQLIQAKDDEEGL